MAASRTVFPRWAGGLKSAMCGVVCVLVLCCVVSVSCRSRHHEPFNGQISYSVNHGGDLPSHHTRENSHHKSHHRSHRRRRPSDEPHHVYLPGSRQFTFHGSRSHHQQGSNPDTLEYSGLSNPSYIHIRQGGRDVPHLRSRRAVQNVNLTEVSRAENSATSSTVLIDFKSASVVDAGNRDYTIVSTEPTEAQRIFNLNPTTGILYLKDGEGLDYEQFPQIKFTVRAVLRSDSTGGYLVTIVVIIIVIVVISIPIWSSSPSLSPSSSSL